MPSTDVAALIEQRLDQSGGELALWIDGMSVRLQRLPGGWFWLAELTLPVPVDGRVMQAALRLTRPALTHFADRTAALCFNPQTEMLCLIVRLKNDQTDYAVALLESICNQCEVWQDSLLSLLKRQSVTMSV